MCLIVKKKFYIFVWNRTQFEIIPLYYTFLPTGNYFLVIDSKHDADAAKRNEGLGKGHERDKRTAPAKDYLYNSKEQQTKNDEIH